MGDDTKIQWTDATWNPVRGCSRVSPGCDNCYAMQQAHRFDTPSKKSPYHGLTTIRRGKVDWTGEARFVPEMLDQPIRWTKPRRIFVNSMSDLFHESLTNEQIAAVFGVMAACPRHTFQVLTKRARRMREWFSWAERLKSGNHEGPAATANALAFYMSLLGGSNAAADAQLRIFRATEHTWPLPNVWLGASAENQEQADERLSELLCCPAAVHWVSMEPLLGPIDAFAFLPSKLRDKSLAILNGSQHKVPSLDWVVVGGESGPGARPCNVEWIGEIVRQCRDAEVACFVKQLGAHYVDAVNGVGGVAARPPTDLGISIRRLKHSKGGDPSEWPNGLRVRQWPEVQA